MRLDVAEAMVVAVLRSQKTPQPEIFFLKKYIYCNPNHTILHYVQIN